MCSRGISTGVSGPFNFVHGRRVAPLQVEETVPVTEPATGNAWLSLLYSGSEDVNSAVASAKSAFEIWSKFTAAHRGSILQNVARKIRELTEEIACLEVRDSGKPLWEAKYDVTACADAFDYFGGIIRGMSGCHVPLTSSSFATVQREPLGVCGGIGAWNFPFLVVSWKAAPALACGNTMVYKPSQLTPVTAVTLAELLHDAGVPEGTFNVVQGGAEVGNLLCCHPDIAKVSFTGSVPTGEKVMRASSSTIKSVTLELGGKSPLIIFEDADLENAVKATMVGNYLSQGQVCSNCTRVFVQKGVHDTFLEKLITETKKLTVGDPFEENTKIGATITKDHADKVLNYIKEAVKQGAKLEYGGERLKLEDPKLVNGQYLSPCILSQCKDNMTVVKEEVFGAVVSILTFDTEEEALRRANGTHFGLAAGVFTKDVARGHRVANNLQAGIVWINNYNLYPPEVPFGGYKMSGTGRENGTQVLEHYTQTKTIMVEMSNVESPF